MICSKENLMFSFSKRCHALFLGGVFIKLKKFSCEYINTLAFFNCQVWIWNKCSKPSTSCGCNFVVLLSQFCYLITFKIMCWKKSIFSTGHCLFYLVWWNNKLLIYSDFQNCNETWQFLCTICFRFNEACF